MGTQQSRCTKAMWVISSHGQTPMARAQAELVEGAVWAPHSPFHQLNRAGAEGVAGQNDLCPWALCPSHCCPREARCCPVLMAGVWRPSWTLDAGLWRAEKGQLCLGGGDERAPGQPPQQPPTTPHYPRPCGRLGFGV